MSVRDGAAFSPVTLGWGVLGAVAAAQCGLLAVVCANHLGSPEITRGAAIETVNRVLRGLPLYPPPSGAFVAADYNPLSALLSAAVARVLGVTPATLRIVAILGSIGAAVLIFLAVRRDAQSAWFGFLAVGLFAGAYRTFDCYLDYPQPDSWMLCTGLLGLYMLETRAGTWWNLLATALLCASFWFKQHGAFLAIAGVLYLTWTRGVMQSIPCWLLAALLGPVAYFVVGPLIFGDHFIFYTYEVPRAYSQFIPRQSIGGPGFYSLIHWAPLAVISVWSAAKAGVARRPSVWVVSFPFVVLMGFLGSLDYSENNVYLAPSVWFILIGVGALGRSVRNTTTPARSAATPFVSGSSGIGRAAGPVIAVLAISFALNLYDPRTVLIPRQAWHDYDDLVQRVGHLDGLVYMPWVAQLPSGVQLPMPVHWVALEDLVRGPGRDTSNHPLVRSILADLVHPAGKAYIITDTPLPEDTLLGFLSHYYALADDFGDRYKSLRAMPGRYSGQTWPRYLYRFDGRGTGA